MRATSLALLVCLALAPVLAGCMADPAEPTGTTTKVIPPVPHLDGAKLLDEVQTYSESFPKRNSNNEMHNAARDWLADNLADVGLEVLRQRFVAPVSPTSTPSNVATDDGTLENILGIKWGESTDEWIIIGGHYDVTDGAVYGAYDDGSGTIMTLQLARAFAEFETNKTIVFFMFDGEEQGLRGSSYFVQSILASQGAADPDWEGKAFSEEFGYNPELFAMIDLDMFGINWPAQPPIYFDENADVVRAYVDDVRKDLGIPDDKFRFTGISAGRSDYAPFEDAGVPIAFFISAFEEIAVGEVAGPECAVAPDPLGSTCVTYPFWHQADTVEGMELIAGDRETLEAGFENAAHLASSLLHFLSTTDGLEIDIRDEVD